MELDPARWATIERLYEQARARPAAERGAFLREACAGDRTLYADLTSMLDADRAGTPLAIERFVDDSVSQDDDAGREPTDRLIGTRLGPWRIDAVLGRGGSGLVYLVHRDDGQYDQRAALKLIAPGVVRPEVVARFHAERRILARLVHPNIAGLIDGGFTPEGTPYLVMEFVDGTALTTHCDDRRATIDERLRLFRIVCAAVEHAHRALVVHRDLKPSNIYVSDAGDVKLLDFGIAKLLDADAGLDTPRTLTEHRALTPAYAAPEQIRGDPVTTATDVYALGVVLYELLTGGRPLPTGGLSPAEAERLVAEREPAPPSAAVRSAPHSAGDARHATNERLAARLRGDLDRICLMALSKEPDRRYASVRQFADDVGRFLDGHPVMARPATVAYRVQRFVRRHRAAVAAAASFVVLLATFAGVATIQARLVAAERDRARTERDKARETVQVLVDLFQNANPEIVPGGDRQPIGEFLRRAEPRVLAALESRPDVRATMTHVFGEVHAARNDFAAGRTLLERAFAALQRLHGPDDTETLEAQIDLGRLLVDMGSPGEARPILEDALARCVRIVGERHALTARTLHALAESHDGDPDEATPLFERALRIRRAVLAPDDPDLASTLDSLAVQQMGRERFDASRALFEEALQVSRRSRGGRHVVALTVTNDYAALLGRLGDFAGSEALHRESLKLAIELVGPETLPVAFSLNNIATMLATEGHLESAVDMCRQAHDKFFALVGPDDGRTANAARNIALMLLWLDRPREARPWMERAIRASEAADGRDARNTIYIRAQGATITLAAGDVAGALRELQAAVPRIERLTPPEGHYQLSDARMYLGRALIAAGQPAAAEPLIRSTLAYRERTLPATHPQIALVRCDLARALAAGGHEDEARRLLESCVPRLEAYTLMAGSARDELRNLLARLRPRPAAR